MTAGKRFSPHADGGGMARQKELSGEIICLSFTFLHLTSSTLPSLPFSLLVPSFLVCILCVAWLN
ncbi:hypothetical protein BDW42DRAFT_143143 [Aspergillus taichungensis]|uniref:Uncharacterized protein n=1 Tax=Aspergillus taichungensis TaxID=482145 RepID=A0A2J5HMX3_9EURO|nr:hypothetical protein BDW42DRAFT_143143 [Aspergillus taichungensis]